MKRITAVALLLTVAGRITVPEGLGAAAGARTVSQGTEADK